MYDRLRADNARILATGFSLAVTFIDPVGVEYTAPCFFADIGMALDANGFPAQGRKVALTVPMTAQDGTAYFTESSNPSKGGWKLRFMYNGVSFYGEVLEPMFDRTFASITMNAGKIKVVA